MKVLVTGATGFIGRHLSYALAKLGFDVNALCRRENHPLVIKHPSIKVVTGDIMQPETLSKAVENCRQVYHTAALAKMWSKDKDAFFRVNVEGTENVLLASRDAGVEKIVHTSTCGVIGPTFKYPMTENDPRITGYPIDYERTKYLAELLVQEYVKKGMNVVIVNPSRVYGEGPVTDSNTVGKMVTKYMQGKWHIIPGSGTQVANYVYVGDVVKGHIAAMEKGVAGQRYILGGEDISYNDFFHHIQAVTLKSYSLYHVPQPIIKLYSQFEKIITELTCLSRVLLPEFADRIGYDQKYDSSKAIEKLGYSITPFKEGLEKTIETYHSLN